MGKGIIEKTQNFIKNNNLFDFLVCVISSKATSIVKRRGVRINKRKIQILHKKTANRPDEFDQ